MQNRWIHTDFDLTISSLEKAFKVGDIATFGLIDFQANEKVKIKLNENQGIDQFPVREGNDTIGILERSEIEIPEDLTARQLMQPLRAAYLISADTSLNDFLPNLANRPYYFVLTGSKIEGIVTRSDVLKLPVRLLAFTRLTHLEMVMAEIIRCSFKNVEDWLQLLNEDRINQIKETRDKLQKEKHDPDFIELAYFADKREILFKCCGLPKSFLKDMNSVENLRNDIAHASDFAPDKKGLEKFFKRMERAQRWITELGKQLEKIGNS